MEGIPWKSGLVIAATFLSWTTGVYQADYPVSADEVIPGWSA